MTGHTGSQSASVAPAAQHQTQQAFASPSTNSALPSTPSPASRPASPSSSPSTSSLVQSSAVPTPQTPRTKLRRCWDKVSTIAAWVAIIFTIASFVRDYLDITKDSPLSPQESWELQNDFRLTCEYDRRAKLQSDACDLELSNPASPPPGVSKRAPHERSALPDVELDDYIVGLLLMVLTLGTSIASIAINKIPSQSREQQPNTCADTRLSDESRKEQDAMQSSPSDEPLKNGDGTRPIARSDIVATFVTSFLLLSQLTSILYLCKYEPLILGSYEEGSIVAHLFHVAGVLSILASSYTTSILQEFLMDQLCMFLNSLPAPVATERQICMQRELMGR